jgi:hypothetical protein
LKKTVPRQLIEYRMDDGRHVSAEFTENAGPPGMAGHPRKLRRQVEANT